MSQRTKAVVVLLGLLACALPLFPGDTGHDSVQTIVQLGCIAVSWYHVRRRPQVFRLGWGLLVSAVTVLGASDMVNVVERHLLDLHRGPAPSNLLALTGYLMLGGAVLQLDRNRSRGRRLPGRIEAAIFAAGVLTPVLVFLVIPILNRDTMSTAAQVITICYAFADLVVATVIARLMLTDGTQCRSFLYLSAALFTSLAGDMWSWATTSDGPASTSAVVKMLWLAGFVLFAAGIAHPSMATFTSGGAWAEDAPRRRRMYLMGLGQAMPAVTLLFAFASSDSTSFLVIGVGGLSVSLLVSARMSGLLTQISDQSAQLSDLARSDELTLLHNRRSWNFELSRACHKAASEGHGLCVALLDLDHFKSYNDSYGHPAGDRLLRAAADAWRSALEPGEVLARYGGEEFAVLVPAGDVDHAVSRLDELRARTPGGQTFSAGVAWWEPGTDPEQSVADADTALYEAKRSGRDRVLAFRPQDPKAAPVIPFSMRTVVQPIVRMRDLSVVAYEALSRFDPATDVEAVFAQAHREGYGDLLESSAIQSALRFPGRMAEIELFVNVSERAMRSPHFWKTIPARLDGVMVELHETRDGLDDMAVSRMLDRFRDRGARVCLDDLVATPADLERIVSLRPDMVKLDRSLVAGCDQDAGKAAEIERMVQFAQAHGVDACAEGVETVAELVLLRSLTVPFVQGYLLGRPEAHWVEPLQPSLRVGELPTVLHRDPERVSWTSVS